jgi:hypothetical protein
MDELLFQRNAMMLLGDMIFSEQCDSIATDLARHARETGARNVYRWEFCLPNPFGGSFFQFVHGHHFVELFYQFMTLTSRFPNHRNRFLARQAEQMARMWIRFANGLPPLPDSEHEPEKRKIIIGDTSVGWQVRTRDEDEEVSKEDAWGERRYKHWQILKEVIIQAASSREGPGTLDEKCEAVRNELIDLDTALR